MKILELLTARRLTGNKGEALAVKLLKKKKYKIIRTNYVGNGHEIDIIAETKEELVFVEVKTRSKDALSDHKIRPAASVTPEKQRAIISAARGYIYATHPSKKIRFDIIEVILDANGGHEICHIESAFNKNTAFNKSANQH